MPNKVTEMSAAVASAVAWLTIVRTEPAKTVFAVEPVVKKVKTSPVEIEIVPMDIPSSWTSRTVVAVAVVPMSPAELAKSARKSKSRTIGTLIMTLRLPGTPENPIDTSYGTVSNE